MTTISEEIQAAKLQIESLKSELEESKKLGFIPKNDFNRFRFPHLKDHVIDSVICLYQCFSHGVLWIWKKFN